MHPIPAALGKSKFSWQCGVPQGGGNGMERLGRFRSAWGGLLLKDLTAGVGGGGKSRNERARHKEEHAAKPKPKPKPSWGFGERCLAPDRQVKVK